MGKNVGLWIAKCFALMIAGWLVLGLLGRTLTPLGLWLLERNGVIPLAKKPTVFEYLGESLHYGLYANPLYGFSLGLVPLHRLREIVSSISARFARPSHTVQEEELDYRRPILWIWVPALLVFLWRFAFWKSPNHSVLAAATAGRLENFFGEPYYASGFGPFYMSWVIDRSLANLMLFFIAYPLGVWFRHQWPSSPEQLEPEQW
jgi:hypothetical protein